MVLERVCKDLGLAYQIMDDVLEISSDSSTLGKSNQSDLANKKLTYVSAYGKKEAIEQAHTLSRACISKLQDCFDETEVMNLVGLARFMVEREN